MKFTYSCTRCGLRHELAEAAPLFVGHFLCDECLVEAHTKIPSLRDSEDVAQLSLAEFSEFIAHNPTRRA